MRGAFYLYSPGGDVGHGVHLFRLAAAVKKRFGRELSLTLLRGPRADFPKTSDWTFGPAKRLPSAAAVRRALLAREFSAADLVVTSFFPLGRTGCAGDLLPALKAARGAGTKIYCSTALPYFSWREEDLPKLYAAAGLYDRIFVHCPPGFDLKYMAAAVEAERRVSRRSFLDVFRRLAPKLSFTGYVMPSRLPAPAAGRHILVHRGGGSTSPDIITCAIKAAPLPGSRLPVVIVAGPASSPAQMRRWRAMLPVGGRVRLMKSADDLAGLLASSAVAVGTAGGTVYEGLRLRRRMVLIPYEGSPGREHTDQPARAALARGLAGARVLSYDGLTPEKLAAAINSALAGPAPAFRGGAGLFRGAEKFADALYKDLCSGK